MTFRRDRARDSCRLMDRHDNGMALRVWPELPDQRKKTPQTRAGSAPVLMHGFALKSDLPACTLRLRLY